MWDSLGKTASQIIQEQDLGLVSDTAQLHNICQKVIDSHPEEVSAQTQNHTRHKEAENFTFMFLMFLGVLFSGSCHQKWKNKSPEQANGPGSERNQRESRSSSGDGDPKTEDFLIYGKNKPLFILQETAVL